MLTMFLGIIYVNNLPLFVESKWLEKLPLDVCSPPSSASRKRAMECLATKKYVKGTRHIHICKARKTKHEWLLHSII